MLEALEFYNAFFLRGSKMLIVGLEIIGNVISFNAVVNRKIVYKLIISIVKNTLAVDIKPDALVCCSFFGKLSVNESWLTFGFNCLICGRLCRGK